METVMKKSDCKYGLVFDKSAHYFCTLMYEAGASMLTEDLSSANFSNS